ncbi:MAG: hypothetical protein GX133_01475, partial [Syntrophomonadaceae bacterium]|nr:hypothetical protein [Syntrophomonadaceae bacterium]
MKSVYIVCHSIWSSKGKISILAMQIFLACLIFNLLLSRFMYLDQVREIIWSSNLDHAVLFSPAARFSGVIVEKLHGEDTDSDSSKYAAYLKMKDKISSYSGIISLGTIRSMSSDQDSWIIDEKNGGKLPIYYEVYDEALLKNFSLPLAEGMLSDLLEKGDKIPAIVSAPLAKEHGGMGSNINFTISQQGKEYTVNIKVAGIFDQDYFTYTLPGGGGAGKLLMLNKLVNRTKAQEHDYFCILPPLMLANNTQPITVENTGFICFANESVKLNDALIDWNRQAKADGLGFFTTFQDLNARQINFTLDKNLKLVALGFILFIVSAVGIGGFNIFRLITEKRTSAIFFMLGMDWATYMRLEALKNCVIVTVPASLALVITETLFSDSDNNLNQMLFGSANIMGTCLIILLFTIISVIIFHFMTR